MLKGYKTYIKREPEEFHAWVAEELLAMEPRDGFFSRCEIINGRFCATLTPESVYGDRSLNGALGDYIVFGGPERVFVCPREEFEATYVKKVKG